MKEREVRIVKSALIDAIIKKKQTDKNSSSGLLLKEYERILLDLDKTTWVLEIWRRGELWAGYENPDPNRVLRWAANLGHWTMPPNGLDDIEAFDYVRQDYDNMDVSFTLVKKYMGSICVLEQKFGEDLLVDAAQGSLNFGTTEVSTSLNR